MKEICIDARMATFSGIGAYIRALLPRLAKESYKWRILIDSESLRSCPELCNFDVIEARAPIYSLSEQITLPLQIPRCDLFWSPHFNIPLAPIKARKRLVTIHDVYFLAHVSELPIHKRWYARHFLKAAAGRSDHVITISEFSMNEILKYIRVDRNKITPIHNGVEQTPRTNAELSSSSPKKYLLYVGIFTPRKNLTNLIKSLDYLPSDIHLVLVGKQSEWQEWKKEAEKRKDRVTVMGKVSSDQLAQLYRKAELLVHPSYYEGFGLTPLEAMSYDCPVVAADIPSLREVCSDAAVYVNPADPRNMAEGILSVWTSPGKQRELRQLGQYRAGQFSWDVSAEKHLEVIRKLL
ncbi:MAG: glycosyltransferase family 4 protein [Verrucomicrobia bacterium]|nr:glycosyltransferase family 4 protein [Verrucomicrobiota bacterium]